MPFNPNFLELFVWYNLRSVPLLTLAVGAVRYSVHPVVTRPRMKSALFVFQEPKKIKPETEKDSTARNIFRQVRQVIIHSLSQLWIFFYILSNRIM